MALISPGLQLTVTDESQYVPGAVGSVPLLVLATEQDKTVNGGYASGTAKENAGKLQVFTSQRELVSALGYPVFKQSASGTPLHGHALNEYGLMAAYSTLALGNRLYAIRADIDTKQLEATTVRPKGDADNGTLWLDLNETSWGIYEWDAATGVFTEKEPILITDANDTIDGAGFVPSSQIGSIGDYAVLAITLHNRIYYKGSDNSWKRVGSDTWMRSHPALVGTVSNPTLNSTDVIRINGVDVTINGASVAALVSSIQLAGIDGITAAESNGKLVLSVDSAADDSSVAISSVSGTALTALGITAGTYAGPALSFADYVNVPSWRATDSDTRPSGSVYIKTSALGNGMNLSVKIYNSDADTWQRVAVPVFRNEEEALYGLDPNAGGFGIAPGTMVAVWSVADVPTASDEMLLGGVKFMRRGTLAGRTVRYYVPQGTSFTGKFMMYASEVGTPTMNSAEVTVSVDSAAGFVTAIMAANLPDVAARVMPNGQIEISHESSGNIYFKAIAGQGNPIGAAGIPVETVTAKTTYSIGGETYYVLGKWVNISAGDDYEFGFNTPYKAPEDGTLWYYGSAAEVDIMINDNGWKGYRNVSNDARGYNLTQTDANGVIVSASKPKTQSDGNSLVAGDLWLDTGDLDNFPRLYRFNADNQWIAIDNTDRVGQNGIVFADARWDTDGTTDVIAGDMPDVGEMAVSNYVDLDAPDYRLFPRGTLLFNTRRSGFNVKKYIGDYFNEDSFPNEDLPNEAGTWVSVSGLKDNGAPYMGTAAQRNMIIKALRSAVDGNTEVREDQFAFNIIAAPGYPELIANMVALNNDRANTAFVIGDTPMTLPANGVEIANWSNNTNGDGLTTADPYLGVFYPAGLANDVQGNTIAVPASHMALRTFIRSDNVSYPWFAPAGVRRGLIDNANDIGYVDSASGGFVRTGINQGLRDSLYENRVNPITVLPGVGLVAWGQKTRNGMASAMDRINVARLVNYIRTILANVGNGFLFEPNDKLTRDQIKGIIEGAMNDLVAKRGIYDYVVVCDTTNNTPERIARNELWVDIAIEPTKAVEFIYIPIRLKNPGDIAKLG